MGRTTANHLDALVAGLVFVAILAFFLLTNLYGAARALIPHSRRSAGRHAQQRSGLMSLRA